MHNFLFGNRRTNYSSYNPFGSQKSLKPGIISKIKNKIYGLFQPTINSQSLIQRIPQLEDNNLEQELSNQFKNNLVLIDRIMPIKEENIGLKRKSIFPFEQYLKEEFDTDKKIYRKTQNDSNRKHMNQKIRMSNSKKQKKFKKDHSKIYKIQKMEENPNQLGFNLNYQNLKQNLEVKQENSSEYLQNVSIKQLKQFNTLIQDSIPFKQQKGETNNYLSPVKIRINQSIIQNDENKNKESNSIKGLKASLSSLYSSSNKEFVKDDLNINKKFSSSTGTNTKGEGNETILSFKNDDFQQELQENIQKLKQNKNTSIFKQNQDEMFQNNQASNYFITKLNQQSEEFKKEKCTILEDYVNQTQKSDENLQLQDFEGSNLIQNLFNGNKQIIQQDIKNEEEKKDILSIKSNTNPCCQEFQKIIISNTDTNIQKQNVNQELYLSEMKIKQDFQNQQEKIIPQNQLQQEQYMNRSFKTQIEKQNQLSVDISKFQDSQSQQQNNEIQKNILQNSFLTNQNKQTIDKNEKLGKEQNPFLISSPKISYDQISLYFQSSAISNQNKQCQSQNQNQGMIDIFKISQQQSSQQIMNKVQDKYNSQNLQQTINHFENPKILQYSFNKQMEINEQSPLIHQNIQNQQQIFDSAKLNYYQQQPTQQNILFQQQQQWQHYPLQIQLQNNFPLQQNTSNQVSSLNLFQSNPYQQQQSNQIMNKPLYLKNDVLSLFQDTKKSDRGENLIYNLDIFQTQQYQQTSQSLNNSLNKGRKKQRINNF
ncbi:unnamed protein product [Paramecium sonneborni]|uniref:Uncharacterized protein n=1 Tax=Paramecium sonneborni TaxID=65129 RepID=A0A8S1M179_9CILI|nr:unnamed protein product [Paramecium sonneborni]